MLADRYDNEVSTSSTAARDAYVSGVDLFLGADVGAEDAFQDAIGHDPDFALAHLAMARNRQVQGDGKGARSALDAARACKRRLTERETGQMAALGNLIEGKGVEAYRAARRQLTDHPRDVMTAQTCLGVFGLIGFSGLHGREAENLALAEILAPSYGDDWWFLCLLGFAQTEVGQLGPAEASLELSLRGNPRNGNAAHYRAHLYYEAGEGQAGTAFLEDWITGYDRRGQLYCHISWHIALLALGRGDIDEMWARTEDGVSLDNPAGPPINVLTDRAAILLRAQMAGVPVDASQWRAVSDYAARCFPSPGLAFADVHCALAHAFAGETEALDRIVRDAKGPAADLVRLLADSFRAMAAGDWALALDHLTLAMFDHERIGGSRAQRDMIEYATALCLLRLDRGDEARRLLRMRRALIEKAGAVAGLNA